MPSVCAGAPTLDASVIEYGASIRGSRGDLGRTSVAAEKDFAECAECFRSLVAIINDVLGTAPARAAVARAALTSPPTATATATEHVRANGLTLPAHAGAVLA